jgi:hypothetical protein
MIRYAKQTDLDTIMSLGANFGHLMLYMKDRDLVSRYISLKRLIVWEEIIAKDDGSYASDSSYTSTQVTGFYHFIVAGDPGFAEMLLCYRQMPLDILDRVRYFSSGQLCVVMQGGCHRDIFKKLIDYLQSKYSTLWCYNSITDPSKVSSKIAGYTDLGFVYDPTDKFTFFNIHKGDFSTYQLGTWTRGSK